MEDIFSHIAYLILIFHYKSLVTLLFSIQLVKPLQLLQMHQIEGARLLQ